MDGGADRAGLGPVGRAHLVVAAVAGCSSAAFALATYWVDGEHLPAVVPAVNLVLVFPVFGGALLRLATASAPPDAVGNLWARRFAAKSRLLRAVGERVPRWVLALAVVVFVGSLVMVSTSGAGGLPERRGGSYVDLREGGAVPISKVQYEHELSASTRQEAVLPAMFHAISVVLIIASSSRRRRQLGTPSPRASQEATVEPCHYR